MNAKRKAIANVDENMPSCIKIDVAKQATVLECEDGIPPVPTHLSNLKE